jgi:hypothetical protein
MMLRENSRMTAVYEAQRTAIPDWEGKREGSRKNLLSDWFDYMET